MVQLFRPTEYTFSNGGLPYVYFHGEIQGHLSQEATFSADLAHLPFSDHFAQSTSVSDIVPSEVLTLYRAPRGKRIAPAKIFFRAPRGKEEKTSS